MKEVVLEAFDALPQALHSRLNVQPGKLGARSIQWIVLDVRRRRRKGECFPPGDGEDQQA
jgi:hypothetical protein